MFWIKPQKSSSPALKGRIILFTIPSGPYRTGRPTWFKASYSEEDDGREEDGDLPEQVLRMMKMLLVLVMKEVHFCLL